MRSFTCTLIFFFLRLSFHLYIYLCDEKGISNFFDNRNIREILIFYIELKRVLIVEQEILNESRSFSLPEKKRSLPIEKFFDWNEMNIEDLWHINTGNLNDLYEQWKKIICEKRPCHHQDKKKEEKSNVI
jgi:hypothetical protein